MVAPKTAPRTAVCTPSVFITAHTRMYHAHDSQRQLETVRGQSKGSQDQSRLTFARGGLQNAEVNQRVQHLRQAHDLSHHNATQKQRE